VSTTLGAFNWSTTRGLPAAGQATLASDPLAAVSNTLRVSITDADGNNRDAVIDTVASGDVIRISDDFSAVVGLPVDNVTYWSFPFTVSSGFVESDEPADADEVTLLSRTPGTWPDLDELALVLNVVDPTSNQIPTYWQTTLQRVLDTAIAAVKSQVGNWDESSDVPTNGQAQAALRMAELLAERPNGSVPDRDPTYLRALIGQRRRFGVG